MGNVTRVTRRGLLVLLALGVLGLLGTGTVLASIPGQAGTSPPTNLPYLFAAFAVVWVGLFLYTFLLSRRHHELQREVLLLRQALQEKESE